jgi:hypothetical protein
MIAAGEPDWRRVENGSDDVRTGPTRNVNADFGSNAERA